MAWGTHPALFNWLVKGFDFNHRCGRPTKGIMR
jgi:hypothetical protein